MLDRDLAELYGVETRVLNQAVQRNRNRFPKDFMFSLTRKEITRISQFVISSGQKKSNLKFSKSVTAFTEHGTLMLSSILNSERAIQVNILIIRAFIKLRKTESIYGIWTKKLEKLESEVRKEFKVHNGRFKCIVEALKHLIDSPQKRQIRIGFKS